MSGHPMRSECMTSSKEKMRRITSRSGGGGSPFLGMSPHKRPDHDGEQHSYHSHEKQFSPEGGKAKKRADRFARGGRAKGGKADSEYGSGKAERARYEKDHAKEKESMAKVPWNETDTEQGPGGELKLSRPVRVFANGGRTGKAKKHKGDVNIVIGMPHHTPPSGGMGAAPVPPAPLPSAGGAAPPPPGGAMGMPPPGAGGAPPMGMPPPGANPMQAQQALGAIAGGGGPMGAGMPGLRARGGKVSSPGLAKHMDHWRGYASKNSKKNTAHEHGATGESRELSLKTPTGRARGGRTRPDAGQATGVARLEQAGKKRRR